MQDLLSLEIGYGKSQSKGQPTSEGGETLHLLTAGALKPCCKEHEHREGQSFEIMFAFKPPLPGKSGGQNSGLPVPRSKLLMTSLCTAALWGGPHHPHFTEGIQSSER